MDSCLYLKLCNKNTVLSLMQIEQKKWKWKENIHLIPGVDRVKWVEIKNILGI